MIFQRCWSPLRVVQDSMKGMKNLSVVVGGRGILWGRGVLGGGMAVSLIGLRGVDGGTLVGDISNESIVVVSRVGGGLDPAVRKGNDELSLDNSLGILGLRLLEVSLAVVIVDSVLVGEGLGSQLLLLVGGGGSVRRGSGGVGSGHEGRGEDNL